MPRTQPPKTRLKRIRLDARDASVVVTSIAVKVEVHQRLMQLALAQHKTFTGIVREALDHYLTRNWPPKRARS
jgi:hypothetical protein